MTVPDAVVRKVISMAKGTTFGVTIPKKYYELLGCPSYCLVKVLDSTENGKPALLITPIEEK